MIILILNIRTYNKDISQNRDYNECYICQDWNHADVVANELRKHLDFHSLTHFLVQSITVKGFANANPR